MLKFSFIFSFVIGTIFALQVHAATTTAPASTSATSAPQTLTPELEGLLRAGEITAKSWLGIVDRGEYGRSWDEMSSVTKNTVKRDEWEKILTKTRKPLGTLKTRDVVDIRSAVNPKNLPTGNYMVMIYRSSFAKKNDAHELVTLFLQNGQWHVLTYQID